MDLTMTRIFSIVFALSMLGSPFLSSAQVSGVKAKPDAVGAETVQKVVSCMVSADFIQKDLRSLGLRIGDKAVVKYHQGSVPGMMPTPKAVHVAVYSADRRHGWFLMAEPKRGGGYNVVRNAYRLKKTGTTWAADEGNGGLASYRAMSKLATKLAETTDYPVELTPSREGCTHD